MTLLTGIVEGYYGRTWDWASRLQCADFLQQVGLNSYLYCPKADAILRKSWREEWLSADRLQLQSMATTYRESGLNWGVGLSPYALYQDYSERDRQRLRQKIESIDALGGNMLAVLFDDMPGDCPDLAARQCDIVADVRAWTNAEHLLVCPTYYSHDPVLERFFGPRPHNYWRELGQGLPVDVSIFWTGNEVCSTRITTADLDTIASELGERLCLWDNYPVNDGQEASQFLHLQPLDQRDNALAGRLRGHFCNPMNQPLLSRLPLSGLATLYTGRTYVASDFYDTDMAQQMLQDILYFQQQGLAGIQQEQKERLLHTYATMTDPAATEICEWLRGDYAFDPECLTG